MTLPRPRKRKDVIKDELDLQEAIRRFKDETSIETLFTGPWITKGDEFHGPCPKCGGKDRFVVQPKKDKAWCRQCGVWGDTLHWAMVMAGMDPSEKGNTSKFLKDKDLL